ncbi:MAG: restriction endonuclease [Lachnospiraceae bacterium]|nr:restriction endonuclease [Lachnospiraceae bacterium]
MIISTKEYPKCRQWGEKVSSMPNIPGGIERHLYVLRDILEKVKENINPEEILTYEGSDSKITLNEACVRLHPMRLVAKTVNGWEVTEESEIWLKSSDDLYLAAFLCANIRFLAEILYYLDTPRKANELKDIAIREYGLIWRTNSSINSRLVWLRQFGLIDFQEFSLLYSITEAGREFLKNVNVVEPSQISKEDDTLKEDNLVIEKWAVDYCTMEQNELSLRRQSIGYIMGNTEDFQNTIVEYLNLIQSGADYDTIKQYAIKHYGVTASSTKTFMNTLVNMDLIKRQTDAVFSLTDIAEMWLETCGIVEFICCVQKNFLFVFEMLNELSSQALGFKELATIGKVSYGLDKVNVDEIRKRITILKKAKLVRNASIDKFVITKRGQMLVGQFNIQERRLQNVGSEETKNIHLTKRDSLFTELRISAKDSMNPDRFEWAIKSAFEALGFKAIRLGGAGKTDVLIHTPGSPKISFSVAIDAKSTSGSSVPDTQIDFDTLEEHRKKHGADYSMVVGCAFQNERLIKRAKEHGVVLMSVDALETLIKRHLEVPIKLSLYRNIFKQSGIADISLVDDDRQKIVYYGKLMRAVMSCLIAESEDPETEGFLFERDIYRSLRDNKEISEPITMESISNMLQFLSSPLVGCVEKTKEGYYATGSLADVARKFSFYSKNCFEDI